MTEMIQRKSQEKKRLDPRTKLYLMLVINVVIFGTNPSGTQLIAKGVLVSIPLILLCCCGKWKPGLVYVILYIAAQFTELFLYTYAAGLWGIVLRMAAQTMCRLVPGLIMGYYLISKTEISAFIAAMERMRVTRKIIIPMAVVFRFLPTIAEEYHAIRDAMRMRGIGLGGSPIAMLEYRLVPLMMSVAEIGNDLSAAALTRGLGSTGRCTHINQIGFGVCDAFFTLAATGAAAAFFLL